MRGSLGRRRPAPAGGVLLALLLAGARIAAAEPTVVVNAWTTPADFDGARNGPAEEIVTDGLRADAEGLRLREYREPAAPVGEVAILGSGLRSVRGIGLAANSGKREYLLFWGGADAAAQRLDSSGRRLGKPVAIREEKTVGEATGVFLPAAKRYALAWVDSRPHASGIYARLLNADGAPAGRELVISNAPGAADWTALAVTAGGKPEGFLAVWQEVRGGGRWLTARAFGSDGSPRASAVAVAAVSDLCRPQAVWEPEGGRYLLFWSAPAGNGSDIFLQRIGPDGRLDGVISTVRETVAAEYLSAACYQPASRRILLLWEDYRRSTAVDIFGQILRPDGSFDGPEIRLTAAAANQLQPRAAALPGRDGWVAVWRDGRSGHYYNDWNITGKVVRADGSPGPDIQVCLLEGQQGDPVVAALPEAPVLAAFRHAVADYVSDIGGRLIDRGYPARGTAKVTVDGGVPRPRWMVAGIDVEEPLGTAVSFRSRQAHDRATLDVASWSPWLRATALPLAEVHARWLQVEVLLATSRPDATPLVRGIAIQRAAKPAAPGE